MNPDIDDLIRDAVRRQEELAVDPGRIHAALPARTARRRRTITVATVGVAVAVAAAVTVPVIVLREPSGGAGPVGSPTATATPMPGLATAPLRYRPTWLPAGFAERERSVPLSDPASPKVTTDRLWKRTALDDSPVGHIGLTSWDVSPEESAAHNVPAVTGGNGSDRAAGQDVDINGRPGHYDSDTVTWQDDHTKIMLYAPGAGLSEDDMLRIARSVKPDPAPLRAPLRVDWLPDGVSGQFVTVRGDSPAKWEARVFAQGSTSYVSASVGTTAPSPRGDEVTVNGRTAHLARVDEEDPVQANYRTHWLLTMDLGEGRYLTVRVGTVPTASQNPLTGDAAVQIAKSVVLDPNPDLDWLGH